MLPVILAGAAIGAFFFSGCSSEDEKPIIPETKNSVDFAKSQKKSWEEESPRKTMAKIGPFECYYKADNYTPSFSDQFKGAVGGPTIIPKKNDFCEEGLNQVEKEVRELFAEEILECSRNIYFRRGGGIIKDPWYAYVELTCLASRPNMVEK